MGFTSKGDSLGTRIPGKPWLSEAERGVGAPLEALNTRLESAVKIADHILSAGWWHNRNGSKFEASLISTLGAYSVASLHLDVWSKRGKPSYSAAVRKHLNADRRPLSIAVYGSSISADNNRHKQGPSWPEQLGRLLSRRFPQRTITVKVHALPGFGATLMNQCLNSLLPTRANVTILEFPDTMEVTDTTCDVEQVIETLRQP